MYPPYKGPESIPRDTLNNARLAHESESLFVSNGYISSTWLIIIGIIVTIESINVKPEKNSPKPINIKLFGNKVLGPIQKLAIPHKNKPAEAKRTGCMILVKSGTIKDISIIPAIKILYISP